MEKICKQTEKKKLKRIAIIGDGLASAICLNKLMSLPGSAKLFVDVYAQRPGIGRGLAYSIDTPDSMLLNHMVRSMRFADSDGMNFLGYLRQHFNQNAMPHDFVPRRIFGDYVENSTAKLFRENVNLGLSLNAVTLIEPGKKKIAVKTARGKKAYDDIIICVGGGNKTDSLAIQYNNQKTSVSGRSVGLLGASLSAIDMVNYFCQGDKSNWPRKITMTQRTPGFRMVRPLHTPMYTPKVFTQALVDAGKKFSCDELMNLIQKEIDAQGISYDLFSYGGLTDSADFQGDLRKALCRLASDPGNKGGQAEFAVFGVMISIVMPLMSVFEHEKILPSEAEMFRQKAEKAIFAFLAPMPPPVAAKLVDLMNEGRLQIECGLQAATERRWRGQFDLCFDTRGVNTITRDYRDLPATLSGITGPDGPGCISKMGGIAYDASTSRMKSAEGRTANLPYIVGQMKKGQQFDTSESQVIYMDCQKIVRDIQRRYKL